MSEKIKHPSFANLYIGRSQCSGQKALFGSSIKHHDTITLKIFPAFIDRDLNMDRYFPETRPYIEVEMSQSQFAQAITSLNMGAGVPVTLRRLHDQYIEPCPFVDKREQFNNEFREDMNALTRKLTEATKHVEKLIKEKKTFNKADKDQILSALKSVTSQLSSHYPYMYSMFNEQMDKTVTEAKAEIESHLQARMEDMALKVAGQEMKATEMLPDEEPDIEEEGECLWEECKMAVLFSHITLSAENGSTETFLCGGIPENEEALENWTAYQNFLEDNPEIESIDVEVKSFLYGEGDIVDADEYEVAYFTKRGPDFLTRSTVKPYEESNFIILTDNEENIEMEMN